MRKDYDIFFDNIKHGSKVLDIGCGEGDFLHLLKTQKNCRGYGVEIESQKVGECLNKGLSVIHGDASEELSYYPSVSESPDPFDYCVIANTLQVMMKTKEILIQAKRVSKELLISIPNFGYWENRLYLAVKGKMPMSKQLSYKWYETPNIHFSTITDFIDLLKELGFPTKKSYYITESSGVKQFNKIFPFTANIFGKSAVFIV